MDDELKSMLKKLGTGIETAGTQECILHCYSHFKTIFRLTAPYFLSGFTLEEATPLIEKHAKECMAALEEGEQKHELWRLKDELLESKISEFIKSAWSIYEYAQQHSRLELENMTNKSK